MFQMQYSETSDATEMFNMETYYMLSLVTFLLILKIFDMM